MTTPPASGPPRPPRPAAEEPAAQAPSAAGAHVGTDVLAYLLSGPLTFGLIGWGLDRWLGTGWIIAVGLVVGMVMSGYLVWLRYGRP